MRVCIGITTKNRKKIVVKAIESALSQDYTDVEVFVFDDGSTDGTSQLRENYPEVRWERSETSLGLLEARNRMMRTCGAEIFVSLDDDAWFLKNDEVRIAVNYFKADPKLAVVAFDLLERDSDRFKVVERANPVSTNFYKGGGHALLLNAVKLAGYYVPFPVKYGHEEKDLGIQIIDLGYDMIFLPGVHVWHDYTPVGRNVADQSNSFIINDLVYKYRRVPLVYVLPVLLASIIRSLRNKVRHGTTGKEAVKTFFSLVPEQKKHVNRVSIKTYLKYRQLSKSYLAYRSENKHFS